MNTLPLFPLVGLISFNSTNHFQNIGFPGEMSIFTYTLKIHYSQFHVPFRDPYAVFRGHPSTPLPAKTSLKWATFLLLARQFFLTTFSCHFLNCLSSFSAICALHISSIRHSKFKSRLNNTSITSD